MKYLKTLALLAISLSTLASCTQGFEDFPTDVYSVENIDESKGTKSNEPNDSTGGSSISIHINEANEEDIDYVITIP